MLRLNTFERVIDGTSNKSNSCVSGLMVSVCPHNHCFYFSVLNCKCMLSISHEHGRMEQCVNVILKKLLCQFGVQISSFLFLIRNGAIACPVMAISSTPPLTWMLWLLTPLCFDVLFQPPSGLCPPMPPCLRGSIHLLTRFFNPIPFCPITSPPYPNG